MDSFLALYFPLVIWSSSANTQPLDMLKVATHIVPEGNACETKEGQIGLCMDIATCQGLLPGSSYFPGNCHGEGRIGETIVCCFQSSGREKVDVSDRQKRQAPPTDTPNLRVRGCGVRGSLTDHVVGGNAADFWPWMASVFVKSNGARTGRFTCGGVVISKRFILTAAHCFGQRGRTTPARSVSVRVGSLKTSEGTEFPVRDVIVHENYRNNLHYDDIALLKTKTDIAVKQVVPACQPSTGMYNANFYGRQATVLGWGDVSYGGAPSDVLMEAILPVISNKRCDSRYKKLAPLSLPRGIIDTEMCAGAEDGSTDACQGDSGGPLLLEDKSGKWNVVGIVSFGYRCGEPKYPGVYTKVAKYLKWLQLHTDIAPPS